MPELGKYSAEVLSAYGVTIVLLVAMCAMTWVRSHRVRRALEQAEARRTDG